MNTLFISIAIIGLVIALWYTIKITRDGDKDMRILNRKLRDSYMDKIIRKIIKDKFLKK